MDTPGTRFRASFLEDLGVFGAYDGDLFIPR